MAEISEIPVIDISAALGSAADARTALAREIRHVYSETGFAYVKGHGIEQDLIDRVFRASAQFHGLSVAEKMKIELNERHRGFIPINTSTDVNSKLEDVKKPNQSESFMMMREDVAADPDVFLSGPNQWPDLDGFRQDVTAYHDAMTALGRHMVDIIALALGDNTNTLEAAFETPTTWLRLLHYPTSAPMAPSDLYGSAPHTDFGFLTFLAQDDVGGLQVMTQNGNWIEAPKIEGTFVVNVGDMLHRWSNGVLRSTPHRVINRSGRARYSCPFFFDPHVNTEISPIVTGQGLAPRFEPLIFGDFLRAELGAGYDKHKEATKP